MKQATLLIVFLAIVSFGLAVPAGHRSPTNTPGDSSVVTQSSMQDMLKQIIHVIDIAEDLELKEANVLNIEATILHKKRYIFYNPSFLTSVNTTTKNKWSVIALLAHEIGHHLNGHTIRRGGSRPVLELEADEFAGFVLYKLGATLAESQNVMYFIARTEATKTHPSRSSRLLAIEKGWRKAGSSQEIITTAKN